MEVRDYELLRKFFPYDDIRPIFIHANISVSLEETSHRFPLFDPPDDKAVLNLFSSTSKILLLQN